MPTLLEAAGINLSKTVGPLDGVSLMPLIREGKLPDRNLYWHFPNYTNQGGRPAGALRSGDWKLIEDYESHSLELYNLAEDISEQRDLSKTDPTRAEQMRAELEKWRVRVGAQMPTPNPTFNAQMHAAIYGDQDSSNLKPEVTAAATEPAWKKWRQLMNAATKDRKPRVTPVQGDIRLHAKDAIVHAKTMRYEPESQKNVLGYWVNPDDWPNGTLKLNSQEPTKSKSSKVAAILVVPK